MRAVFAMLILSMFGLSALISAGLFLYQMGLFK